MTAQIADSILIEGHSYKLCTLPLEVLFNSITHRPTFFYTASKEDGALGSISSANWRGYIASWKIADDRLWLVEFHGRLNERNTQEEQSALIDIGLPRNADSAIDNHRLFVETIEALPEISFGIRESNERWRGSSVPDTNGFIDRELANGINIEELYHSDISPVSAVWYSGLLRIPMGEQLEYHHAGFLTEYETDLIIEIEAGAVRRQWLINNKPGVHAKKQAQNVRQKSLLSTVPPNENGNESEYSDAIKEPLEAIRILTKTNTNLLYESIHHFLRSHFFLQAAGSAVMSQTDQEARTAYDKAISHMNEASIAIGMTISLRRDMASDAAALSELPLNDFTEIMLMKTGYCKQAWELMLDLHIPSDDKEQIEWAIDKIRSTVDLIAEGRFELLGAARSIIYEFTKTNSPA
jgi:hypothetical protein